jgi:hypothetical protein
MGLLLTSWSEEPKPERFAKLHRERPPKQYHTASTWLVWHQSLQLLPDNVSTIGASALQDGTSKLALGICNVIAANL